MKIILEKGDLTWLQKNGYLGQEQVGIVWDQLTQRCNVIQDASSSSSHTSHIKHELELPHVEGILLGEPKTNDICIAFSLKNGEVLARSLQSRLTQKKKKVILASQNGKFDPKESEIQIASSTALVVLLTEDCLKQVEVVFALVVAKFYYQHPSLVILVHDAESCYFPSYDEQPESVRDFFSEKAITFLSCYPEEGVAEINGKFDSEAHVLKNIMNNFKERPTDALYQFLAKNENRKFFPIKELRQRMKPYMTTEQLDEFEAMADKNKDGTLDPEELQEVLPRLKQTVEAVEVEEESPAAEEPEVEDLVTRVFLSHKRSTGQGIAGRLYEGLKSSYKVFIDSEAKFKIHNLKLIVQSTDVLVFILSYGILLSKWCLEELRSAIENKKKIIVVRELSFKYPDVLPDEWLEVEPVLQNSRELVWIAEYNFACVRALKNLIGSNDERYRPAAKYFSSRDGKAVLTSILKKFQTDKILDLNRTIPVPSNVEVDAILDFVLESVPPEEITIVHISCNAENNEGTNSVILPSIFSRLPNIHELDLAGCGALVTPAILKDICTRYPFLKKLDLDQCVLLTSEAMKPLKELDQLTLLNLDKIKELKDDAVEILSTGCPSLEVLKLNFADLTHKSFEYLPAMKNLKEVDFPYTLQNHEDAKKFIADHPEIKVSLEPIMFDCMDQNSTWYPAVPKSYQATQILVHFYGEGEGYEETILKSQMGTRIAKFKSHKDGYGYQDLSHSTEPCSLCEPLHALLEHDKFSDSKNKHFINDWYFKEQDGIDHLKTYLEDAAKGFVDVSSSTLPTGIKAATFMNALFETYPEESIKQMYLDASNTQEYADFLKTVPHLKMLSYRKWAENDLAEFKIIADAFPSQLEYLDWNVDINDECAELLATKVPNVTTLHLYVGTYLTDKGLLPLFGENCKYQTLTIRNARSITVEALEQIAPNCKHVADLNLTLNEALVQQKDKVIDILIKNFPSLKKLVIDWPILNCPKFGEFKKARPDVEIPDFESLYLRDAVNYYNLWFPAIQVNEKKFPKETVSYHLYGVGSNMEYNLYEEDDKAKMKPFRTHIDSYAAQDYHATNDCFECSLIHDFCEKFLFDGKQNKFFINNWYFEQEEGKDLLKKFLPSGPLNRITFDVELPDGVEEWGIIRSLAKELDLEKTYTLNFPKNVNNIEKILDQPLPISGLELPGRSITYVIPLLEKLPKLTRLDCQNSSNSSPESFKKLNAPNMEYLDLTALDNFTDDVVEGLAKCTKLTYLNLSATGVTDKGIEVLAPSWSNMINLNLRLLPITQPTIELICKHCPKLESLNLILCNKLPSSSCKLIQESLPNLKELKVPFHWLDAEEYTELNSARPDIKYCEKTELADALYETENAWYPAVILFETAKSAKVHYYGLESNYNAMLQLDSPKIAPLFSKQEEYGKQQPAHCDSDCPHCALLHSQCEHILFGKTNNYVFINDWYLDSPEGRQLINNVTGPAQVTGKLDLNVVLPPGLHFDIFAQAAIDGVHEESLRQIVFAQPVAVENFEAMLSEKPNLHTLILHGAFTDEHAAVIASKCEGLTHLSLFGSEITSEGLQTLAETLNSLETLNIKLCKKITDKGLEAILLANKKMETLEVDFHFQLTTASVRLLGRLSKLHQLTAHYKITQQEIVDAITALKKKKPNLTVARGRSIYDILDTSDNWYPGFATDYNDAEKKVFMHCFGWSSSYDAWYTVDEESKITEPFVHTKTYGSLSSGHMKECETCKQFQSMCTDSSFSGRKVSYYSS